MAADKSGAEFDPAIHHVKEGAGVLTKEGLWRRKGGQPKKAEVGNSILARLDLLEKRLAEKDARIAELQTPDPRLKAEQQRAAEELAALRPTPALRAPVGPAPALVPYRGAARALVDCHIGGAFQRAGEVFPINVPALWSDDPYVAITAEGELHPMAVQIDFRFRQRSHDALAAEALVPRVAGGF